MNYIFSCQSSSANFMVPMALEIKKLFPVSNIIFFISDCRYFWSYIKSKGLGKEIAEFKLIFLSDILQNIDSNSFWGEEDWRSILKTDIYNFRDIINCDRRLKYGKKSQYDRIYTRQLSDKEQQRVLARISYSLKSSLVPGKVVAVSFACNIVTDMYLALCNLDDYYFYNIRSARFKNYIFVEKSFNDPSPEFAKLFKEEYKKSIEDNVGLASGEIESKYEGVQHVSSREISNSIWSTIYNFLGRLSAHDYHCDPSIISFYMTIFRRKFRKISPFRERFNNTLLPEEFFIFPLHAEPEVSLDVYSRFSLSQVELAEKFAVSLPLGVSLVCKEHPWMSDRYNRDVYKKLSRISNIFVVGADRDLESLVPRSKGLVSFCGSTGLLALKHRKPLFVFGDSYFSLLCNRMVWTKRDPRDLTEKNIQSFVSNYKYDGKGVVALLSSIKTRGLQVNLYSGLLKRKEALAYDPIQKEDQISSLIRAVLK